VDREGQSEGSLPSFIFLLMKYFGVPKILQWEGMIQKDLEKYKNNSKLGEAN
jgi:hypothetical protein